MTSSRLRRRPGRRGARAVAASALVAGVAAVTLMSACSAGQITQTGVQVPAVAGVNVNAGPNGQIGLRDLLVAYNGPQGYPQGGNAPLVVRIFNDTGKPVKLVRVSAGDAARSVALVSADPGPRNATPSLVVPPASPSAEPSPAPSAAPSPGGASSPSPAASPPPTPTPVTPPPAAGVETFSIEVPSSGFQILVPGEGSFLQLTGLTRPLGPGTTVPLTFTFDDGTSVSVNVPFGVPTAAVPRASAEEHQPE